MNVPSKRQDPAPATIAMATLMGTRSESVVSVLRGLGPEWKKMNDQQIFQVISICAEHKLNPITKEVYVINTGKGLVPYISVDGWNRLIAKHKKNHKVDESFRFIQKPPSGDREAYEKLLEKHTNVPPHLIPEVPFAAESKFAVDGSEAAWVTETFLQAYQKQKYAGPWDNMPSRMLRHKARRQAAREAFSIAGIYDPDEAAQIIEAEYTVSAPDAGNAGVTQFLEARIDGPADEGATGSSDSEPDRPVVHVEIDEATGEIIPPEISDPPKAPLKEGEIPF